MDSSLRNQLDQLLCNRRTPEARELYLVLARYAERRVRLMSRNHFSDIFGATDCEDLVGDVLMQLMTGSLAQFRGETIAALLAFVKQVTDRTVWRAARKRLRERDTLSSQDGERIASWNSQAPKPDEGLHLVPESPLSDKDTQYLQDLFAAGSRAALACDTGVSRAAVTQRLNRIRGRIDEMAWEDRAATEAWATHAAWLAAREA